MPLDRQPHGASGCIHFELQRCSRGMFVNGVPLVREPTLLRTPLRDSGLAARRLVPGIKKSPASGTPGAVTGEHLPSMRRRPVRNGLEEQTFHGLGKLVPASRIVWCSWIENGHREALWRYDVLLKIRLRAPLDRRRAQLVRTKNRNLFKCFLPGRRKKLTPGFPLFPLRGG